MSTTVFISYAANDPAWPSSEVRRLGGDLEKLGATVLLDEFFLERRQPRAKPSPLEWKAWMDQALGSADHIVCLCSQRYRQAAERDLADPSGFGVAYESLKLIYRLYLRKGRNDGRILTLGAEGASIEAVVPDDLQPDCPHYRWPREREAALEHASRERLDVEPSSSLPAEAAATCADVRLSHRQAQHTRDVLLAAPQFFQAVKKRRAEKQPVPSWAGGDVDVFVAGLAAADQAQAQQLMWDVRAVLKQPQPQPDPRAMDAAVAVYMLCACRWMPNLQAHTQGQAMKVPFMPHSTVAVLSAALFGGRIMLDRGGAQPVPQHVYDVRVAAGESAPINLLRAIHSALYRDEMAAVEEARLDRDDDAAVQRLMADITARVDGAREVDGSAFTLLIDDPRAFDAAPWRGDLGVVPFCFDDKVGGDLLGIDSARLDREIREFWSLVRPATAPKPTPAPPSSEAPMAAPPGIQITATNVTMTTGQNSPAHSHVTQIQGAKLEDLLPSLQALIDEIGTLAPRRLRDSLEGQANDIVTIIENKPADAKSRITMALEKIKLIADAAEGTETVVDKVTQFAAFAAPILAALS